ncbi:hypothetical protein CKW47_21185, partial [Bordetella pertussis]
APSPCRPARTRTGWWRALYEALPFALTGAQQRVVAEIAADLAQPYPMRRALAGQPGRGRAGGAPCTRPCRLR